MVEPLNEKGLEAARKIEGQPLHPLPMPKFDYQGNAPALPAPDGELEVVGRLNCFAGVTPDHPSGGSFLNAHAVQLVNEAVSTILSLTRERDEAREEHRFALKLLDDEAKKREAAEAQVRVLEKERDEALAVLEGVDVLGKKTVAALEAQVRVLREAK